MRIATLKILIETTRLNFTGPTSNIVLSGHSTEPNSALASSTSPPPSAPIVMNITECHKLLKSKLEHTNNDLNIFETKKAAKSITKILVKYHENFDSYQISNKAVFISLLRLHFMKLDYVAISSSEIEHKSQIQMLHVRSFIC